MQKSFAVYVALILAFTCVSCNSSKNKSVKRLPGIWQLEPITVDGSNKDWPSPYPEYDDKAMLGYAVSNDKDNLYITVETGDAATQLKILKEGLTVWIDRKGDKEEVTAINYPIPVAEGKAGKSDRPAPMHAQQGQSGGNSETKARYELEDRVKRMMDGANEYSLQGFKSCNLQYPIMENDSCGIKVRMTLDADNELVWEAVVPFRTFYFKNEITRADKGRPISICFETTGSKRPAGEQAPGNRGSGGGMRPGMSVGMGGGMGMGMRMGGGGGNRGGNNAQNTTSNMMESLYKSTKTYKKFGVAFQ